jgi:hypothetical protein
MRRLERSTRRRLGALLFALGCLASLLGESCTADMDDLENCHAIASALCTQSSTCMGFSVDHDTCVSQVVAALPGTSGGPCNLGGDVQTATCIQAIQSATCGRSVPNLQCGSRLLLVPTNLATPPPGQGGDGGSR